MVMFSFNTGDLFIEYFKIDGEIFLSQVCLDFTPIIRRGKDITKKILGNYSYMKTIHTYIEEYEQDRFQSYISEYHNEQRDHEQN